ncbi:carboxypeptidase O [Caerostris extrusa]|uniref:Carboxypeptidase O n=1 Tax=Caerostris extrusa TaxID=172846 RepID=A0AAV4PV23_CAEEX|nr:carboxypeptidase O [Caerostris extrusa]
MHQPYDLRHICCSVAKVHESAVTKFQLKIPGIQTHKLFKVYMHSEKDVQALKRIEEKCQVKLQLAVTDEHPSFVLNWDKVLDDVASMDCIIQWTDYFARNTKVILHVNEDLANEVRDDLTKHNLTHEMLKESYHDLVKKERNPLRSPQHDEFGYNYAKHNGFGAISKDWSNTKPIIMIECGIHAREWASVEACIYFISVLLKQKTENIKRIMNSYDFVILPLLNPDGYVYSMSKSRFWRKNRHCDKSHEMCDLDCIGVDLNRNFDINFCLRGPSVQRGCGKERVQSDNVACTCAVWHDVAMHFAAP